MQSTRTERARCPRCQRREVIEVTYNVVTGFSSDGRRRDDTRTTVSAECRQGHDLPNYVGELG